MKSLVELEAATRAILSRRWLRLSLGADCSVDDELLALAQAVREGAAEAMLQGLPLPALTRQPMEKMAFPSSEAEFDRAVEDFFISRVGSLESITVGDRVALLESYLRSVIARLRRVAPDVTGSILGELDRRIRNEPASDEQNLPLTTTADPPLLAKRIVSTLYLMVCTAGDRVDLLSDDVAEAVEWLGQPLGRFPL